MPRIYWTVATTAGRWDGDESTEPVTDTQVEEAKELIRAFFRENDKGVFTLTVNGEDMIFNLKHIVHITPHVIKES